MYTKAGEMLFANGMRMPDRTERDYHHFGKLDQEQ